MLITKQFLGKCGWIIIGLKYLKVMYTKNGLQNVFEVIEIFTFLFKVR